MFRFIGALVVNIFASTATRAGCISTVGIGPLTTNDAVRRILLGIRTRLAHRAVSRTVFRIRTRLARRLDRLTKQKTDTY